VHKVGNKIEHCSILTGGVSRKKLHRLRRWNRLFRNVGI